MIVVHSLAFSRSVRVVWLLEEIGAPYELRTYARNDAYRSPADLLAMHPLGKSPVIEDGELTLGESSAILRHINTRHGGGRFAPAPRTDDHARHDEWLDSAEGSFARSIVAHFWKRKTGTEVEPRMRDEFVRNMAHLGATVGDRRYIMGDRLMLADIQFVYLLAMAAATGALADQPQVLAYWDRLTSEPGLQRALARTGPMMPEGL